MNKKEKKENKVEKSKLNINNEENLESNEETKEETKKENSTIRKLKKIFKMSKKAKKRLIIILVIIILVCLIFKPFNQKPVEENKIETQAIEKRDIATSIGATGKIETSNTKNVVSSLTGMEIKTVNVKEGDTISIGDVICTFDMSNVEENLKVAQNSLNISNAQGALGIQSAQRNLNDSIKNKDTQVNITKQDTDNALKAYQDAQNELSSLQNTLASKKSARDSFIKTYNSSLSEYTNIKAEYDKKESTYNQATNSYNAGVASFENAQIEYNKYFVAGTQNQLNPSTGTVIDPSEYQDGEYATPTHRAVMTNYNQAQATLISLETNLNTVKSDYLNSKSIYDNAVNSYSPLESQYQAIEAEISSLEANVKTLQANVDSLKNAYDKTVQAQNSAVSTADSNIASMQDALSNSELSSSLNRQTQQAQINTYQDQLEKGVLTSTVDGTVTSVNAKPGDIYTGSTIAVIEGVQEFIIEAEIDEYDIADVEVGMEVLIKTDATRDEELKGRIIYVAQSATDVSEIAGTSMTSMTTSGTSNATYKIQIALDTQNDRLRIGMNARLSIITDSREDVWTVPIEAIHEKDDGSKYIEILKNEQTGEKEELKVETGFESSYYIEINSDKIKEGMKVVMPDVEADNSVETLIEMMGADAGI